jgi:hypothetical protein
MTVNKPLFTFIAIAALSLLSAGSVMAQDATVEYARPQAVTSLTTRADVQAQAAAFRATGAPAPFTSKFSNATQRVAAPQPRAAVKAEVLATRASDSLIAGGEVLRVEHPFVRVPASSTVAALQR